MRTRGVSRGLYPAYSPLANLVLRCRFARSRAGRPAPAPIRDSGGSAPRPGPTRDHRMAAAASRRLAGHPRPNPGGAGGASRGDGGERRRARRAFRDGGYTPRIAPAARPPFARPEPTGSRRGSPLGTGPRPASTGRGYTRGIPPPVSRAIPPRGTSRRPAHLPLLPSWEKVAEGRMRGARPSAVVSGGPVSRRIRAARCLWVRAPWRSPSSGPAGHLPPPGGKEIKLPAPPGSNRVVSQRV